MSLGEMSQPSGSTQPFDAHLYLVTYRNGQPLYPDALTQQQTAMHPVFRPKPVRCTTTRALQRTIRRHAVPFDGLTTQPPLWVHAHFQQRGARAAVQGPFAHQPGLIWFCGPGVVRVVGCYW